MSLHVLLARVEACHVEASRDATECDGAREALKEVGDRRRKDATAFKRLAIRTRGMIEALNDLNPDQRQAIDLASLFGRPAEAEDVAPALDATVVPADEPTPAEPMAIEPAPAAELPKSAQPAPAARSLNDRIMAELNRVRGNGAYASVEFAELRKKVGGAPSKVTVALTALVNAGRLQKVKAGAGADPGWVTFKVLDAVEQAA